jgi:hypothetical protein
MLYLSVHQIIKENITKNTAIGIRLQESFNELTLSEAYHQVGVVDAVDEMKFTAVHYDLRIVMELLQQTIAEKRSNQRFILVEGLCNSSKIASEANGSASDDQLSLRFMDELFAIEKCLGEINSVVSLTFQKEEQPDPANVKFEEFEEEEVVEKEVKLDEDGNPIVEEEAPAEEEGEKKKVVFNPK